MLTSARRTFYMYVTESSKQRHYHFYTNVWTIIWLNEAGAVDRGNVYKQTISYLSFIFRLIVSWLVTMDVGGATAMELHAWVHSQLESFDITTPAYLHFHHHLEIGNANNFVFTSRQLASSLV